MSPNSATLSPIIEVDQANFQTEVIERSKTVPVVVDFWAPWCGPCRMIGPVLEKLATEAKGAWILAKLNTDENQSLAMQHRISGIPAVKAFLGGKVIDEFVGAVPEPQVRKWLAGFLPGRADELSAEAERQEQAGNYSAAMLGYRNALAEDAEHAGARLGVGRTLFAMERFADALTELEQVPFGGMARAEAEGLMARARFRLEGGPDEAEIRARHRVAEHPDDLVARIALARALAGRDEYRDALEGLLAVVKRDAGEHRDSARQAMLDIFTALGDAHPLCEEYRPQLAAALW
ncbi:MAG: tetratricopeptide repeat protein [Caldilineae bacterium]|nr:tetratricopeptide repeat protein [Chloroflexota bacterium]MCB9175830.1 tetratricopeptide repeat protein [Caldilineae bacterium]